VCKCKMREDVNTQDAGRGWYILRLQVVVVASFCRHLQTCMWKTKMVGICPDFIGSYEDTIGEELDAKQTDIAKAELKKRPSYVAVNKFDQQTDKLESLEF
jgi:hypothetical protein